MDDSFTPESPPNDLSIEVSDFFTPSLKDLPMFDDNAGAIRIDPNHYGYPPIVPERGLVAGILWRSFYDLEAHVDSAHRKDAIAWFEAKPRHKQKQAGFAFSDIIYYLNLGERELKIIRTKIQQAIQIELEREAAIAARIATHTTSKK